MSAHSADGSGGYSASPALAPFFEAQKPHLRGDRGQITVIGVDTSSSPRQAMELRC